VVLLPSLPRNATGKILKTALRQLPIGEEAGSKNGAE
jgi:acyl-coenzyme A synthetase/AMP-(fatty) acid ligase